MGSKIGPIRHAHVARSRRQRARRQHLAVAVGHRDRLKLRHRIDDLAEAVCRRCWSAAMAPSGISRMTSSTSAIARLSVWKD